MVGVGVAAVSMFVQCSAPVPVPVAGGGTEHVKAVPGRAGLITAYLSPLTAHRTT